MSGSADIDLPDGDNQIVTKPSSSRANEPTSQNGHFGSQGPDVVAPIGSASEEACNGPVGVSRPLGSSHSDDGEDQQGVDIGTMQTEVSNQSEASSSPDTTNSQLAQREKLEEERQSLRSRILETRKRRAAVRRELGNVTRHSTAVFHHQNSAEADRLSALTRYRSATNARALAQAQLTTTRKLDVTNDCFHIWHRGPFGTINGLRLGTDITATTSPVAIADGGSGGATVGNAPPGSGGGSSSTSEAAFDLSSMVAGAAASLFSDSTGSAAGSNGGGGGAASFDSLKVPWSETNAALGQVVLLLSVLQQKPNSGIVFRTHKLIPLGSCSKVGILQPDGRPSVEYNLFYSDESFSFFGKRNFNTALDGLFHCLKDAIDVASTRDRTIIVPHEVIIPSGQRGEIRIGGLPPTYDGTNGETWSRAMKYLLTDLKWLVSFAQKNIDR